MYHKEDLIGNVQNVVDFMNALLNFMQEITLLKSWSEKSVQIIPTTWLTVENKVSLDWLSCFITRLVVPTGYHHHWGGQVRIPPRPQWGHFNEFLTSLIFLEIWISINATNQSRNSWSGEYTLYSILKNKYPTWKRNDIILAYNDPLPDWVFTTENSYLRHKERQSFISTFYIRTPGNDLKS